MAQPVVVILPSALADLFPEDGIIVLESPSTVDVVMNVLDRRWPGMRDRPCDSRPAIRRHINVFVDGERATLATVLKPGTEVYVLTAISGG